MEEIGNILILTRYPDKHKNPPNKYTHVPIYPKNGNSQSMPNIKFITVGALKNLNFSPQLFRTICDSLISVEKFRVRLPNWPTCSNLPPLLFMVYESRSCYYFTSPVSIQEIGKFGGGINLFFSYIFPKICSFTFIQL